MINTADEKETYKLMRESGISLQTRHLDPFLTNIFLKELTDFIQHLYQAPTYSRFYERYKNGEKHIPYKGLQSTGGDKTHIQITTI